MEHFYKKINGFFDFEDIYKEMIAKASDGAKFVEVGAFLGKSTAYMCVEIINSGKRIHLDVVDMFDLDLFLKHPQSKWIYSLVNAHRLYQTDTLLDIFERNIEPVKNYITNIHRGKSVETSRLYGNGTLDFVFIDADHKYESVKADIAAWLPKVRPGGHIAGHDYHSDWPGVQKAVDEVLGKGKFVVRGHSWFCGIPHE